MHKVLHIILIPLTILLFISSAYSARTKTEAMAYAQREIAFMADNSPTDAWTTNTKIVNAYPVYLDGVAGVSYYECRAKNGRKNAGYVLVNVNETDLPIVQSSAECLPLKIIYRKLLGHNKFNVLRYDPYKSIAVSKPNKRSSGTNILASIGFEAPGIEPLRGGVSTQTLKQINKYKTLITEKQCHPMYTKEILNTFYQDEDGWDRFVPDQSNRSNWRHISSELQNTLECGWHTPQWKQVKRNATRSIGCGNAAWSIVYGYWDAFKGKSELFWDMDVTTSYKPQHSFSPQVTDCQMACYEHTKSAQWMKTNQSYTLPWYMPDGIAYARNQGYTPSTCYDDQGSEYSKFDNVHKFISSDKPCILLTWYEGYHYVVIEAACKSQEKYLWKWHDRNVKYLVNFGFGPTATNPARLNGGRAWIYVRDWGADQHFVWHSWRTFLISVVSPAGPPPWVDLTNKFGLDKTYIDPVGYYWDHDNAYHIFYMNDASPSVICELKLKDGEWSITNLTNLTGAVKAKNSFHAYTWDVDKTQHVVYVGVDNHVHELYNFYGNSNWRKNDLTEASGASPPAAANVFGYISSNDNSQRVLYVGKDDHQIHQLHFNDGVWWTYTNLTQSASAPIVHSSIEKLSGYSWKVDRTEHVVYRSMNNRIYELYSWRPDSWRFKNISIESQSPVSAMGAPFGFASDIDESQHVVFPGLEDRHIHELTFKAGSWWTDTDITEASGVNLDPHGTVPLNQICCYVWEENRSHHIFLTDLNMGHMYRYSVFPEDNNWLFTDLTATEGYPLGGGNIPALKTFPTGFTSELGTKENFIYRDIDGNAIFVSRENGRHSSSSKSGNNGAQILKPTAYNSIPENYALEVNGSIIKYALPKSSPVDLKIYSIKGQLIYELNKPEMEAGYYSLNMNECLSKGYYVIQFASDKFKSTKKLVVVR